MSRRSQVVLASAMLVIGVGFFAINLAGGLNAASFGQAGTDITKYFLWGGVGLLVISALLYIRASAE